MAPFSELLNRTPFSYREEAIALFIFARSHEELARLLVCDC